MKRIKITAIALLSVFSLAAQDVDEILSTYFENTGGYDNWGELNGIKITAKLNQGGLEFPLEIVQMADGRQYTKFEVQGSTFKQGVFDGETVWSTNFQSLKAEKADAETTGNVKLDANDFPDSFYDYKKKGYQVELLGTETFDGTEVYKISLKKENKMIDGNEVEDIIYYYFDTEAMVPLAQESEVKQGPGKGSVQIVKFSEYDEVDGFYFPYSLSQGVKGGESQPIIISSIEVNPTVDDDDFKFPEE